VHSIDRLEKLDFSILSVAINKFLWAGLLKCWIWNSHPYRVNLSLWYFGGMGRQFSEQIDADF
jgi:hypothetical protein